MSQSQNVFCVEIVFKEQELKKHAVSPIPEHDDSSNTGSCSSPAGSYSPSPRAIKHFLLRLVNIRHCGAENRKEINNIGI